MEILVDTSIWIDYFRSGEHSGHMDYLIDENLLVINDIILAELIPYLQLKRQATVIELLQEIKRLPMHINWTEIIEFQTQCLQNGANGIGIPDLLIAQNAKSNHCAIYAMDKHFRLLEPLIQLQLYQGNGSISNDE